MPPFQRKGPPSDRTFLQIGYISQLARDKTPIVVKLTTNREMRGYIQYYDKNFIRITGSDGSRYFIFYHDIKYLYEDSAAA
jgi:sRNA-binding regulator protein Hfq